MSTSPYAAASDEKLEEIIRLAEARLAAQLTLGVAADQRALAFASLLAALAAAAVGGIIALRPEHHTHWSLIIMAVGFAVALLFALFAAQPVEWDLPGSRPISWQADIVEGDSLHNGMAAMAGWYDEMIGDNTTTMASNGNLLRGAFVSLIVTLIVAGGVALTVG